MISLSDIQHASNLLRGKVMRTPMIYSQTFSDMTGAEVYLKLESLQLGGSFKVRGATCKILSHIKDIKAGGVVAASVGNHAQGVALAARAACLPATIIMPVWASLAKQQAAKGYGAELLLRGESLVESIAIGRKIAAETQRLFIHPYDDDEVMAGQGTIGLEIMEDLTDADYIFVPVGGGGLIASIAAAAKAIRPTVHVVGVQSSACPSALEALRAGGPVDVEADERGALADAIMVSRVGDSAFPIL